MRLKQWCARAALWVVGLACAGAGLTGCTTSRDAYSQSSGISTYGVVDVGVERTSR
ncbi:hypothetical protein ACKZDW_20090 [Ralstonia syzygii subsp. celebesensis]|uniref:Transmembrane lipoprotein n=2 Tax=Ralstonia syzygii TaxID=28097 RepID=G3A7B8_9RALS|nr:MULTISPECIES: hypothetical protein [Ralstonia solanacearum species complex]CAH0445738.1 hypothetical protein LMG10661_01919 [Ralstonia syzygii subsp. syzygii]CCA79991.1 conserved exported hypothetical protein [blood disease bacterium R229]BEU71972.1 hypothetical protein MAFF211271_15270 [Ralstonia pseudosolanacearum]QQV56530.1 hypothetical protein JK151_06065 [Ralstonia syzygii subsp. celebesensis]CBJ51067.1 conserved exported protein of unknown function [Ralstonia solanacearum PSI07]